MHDDTNHTPHRDTIEDGAMLIVVDPSSGVPVFRQLMDQVRFHIASGLLKAGDELPATRALSAELGVNPMTVSKAYNLLERDGVLERRPGRPLVVADLDPAVLETEKVDRLRANLADGVRAAKQLGFEPDEAVRIFRGLLDRDDKET
jgi:GntR family transcriptional regulator